MSFRSGVATYLLNGVIKRADDVLCAEVEVGNILVVLSKGLSGDGHLGAIDEVGVLEQVLHQCRDTADFVKILHDVLARWSVHGS